MADLMKLVVDENSQVQPKAIAATFHTTLKEVAQLSGLSIDAVSKSKRISSSKSQRQLRDMMLILNRAAHWSGDSFQAYAWYRSEPIPSFGDQTANDMVKRGQGDLVMSYLSRIADGGFA